jgi:hypothetical protein
VGGEAEIVVGAEAEVAFPVNQNARPLRPLDDVRRPVEPQYSELVEFPPEFLFHFAHGVSFLAPVFL